MIGISSGEQFEDASQMAMSDWTTVSDLPTSGDTYDKGSFFFKQAPASSNIEDRRGENYYGSKTDSLLLKGGAQPLDSKNFSLGDLTDQSGFLDIPSDGSSQYKGPDEYSEPDNPAPPSDRFGEVPQSFMGVGDESAFRDKFVAAKKEAAEKGEQFQKDHPYLTQLIEDISTVLMVIPAGKGATGARSFPKPPTRTGTEPPVNTKIEGNTGATISATREEGITYADPFRNLEFDAYGVVKRGKSNANENVNSNQSIARQIVQETMDEVGVESMKTSTFNSLVTKHTKAIETDYLNGVTALRAEAKEAINNGMTPYERELLIQTNRKELSAVEAPPKPTQIDSVKENLSTLEGLAKDPEFIFTDSQRKLIEDRIKISRSVLKQLESGKPLPDGTTIPGVKINGSGKPTASNTNTEGGIYDQAALKSHHETIDKMIDLQNKAPKSELRSTVEYQKMRQHLSSDPNAVANVDQTYKDFMNSPLRDHKTAITDAWFERKPFISTLSPAKQETLMKQLENFESQLSVGGKYFKEQGARRKPKFDLEVAKVRAAYDEARKKVGLQPVGEGWTDPEWGWIKFDETIKSDVIKKMLDFRKQG